MSFTDSLPRMRTKVIVAVVVLVLAGCAAASTTTTWPPPTTATTTTVPPATTTTAATTTTTTTTTTEATTTTVSPYARPSWLGTRPLPLGPDGKTALPQPTPPELQDRQFETIDYLPTPDGQFASTIQPVPDDVLARSTWSEECPVTRDELAYLTVSHYGFDGKVHTGELIVNASVAEDIVSVFHELYDARFPIEEMRVTSEADLEAPPTGDGNDTGSFVCRPTVGATSWSQHAYGLAVDVNPFQNPYVNGDVIIPELASSYTDRDWVRPGMIFDGDAVVQAFADVGWTWGGDWNTLKDRMHFSQNGR
jgi:hypothetical protein